MVRCPLCTKIQLVFVKGPTRTSCYSCGAQWVQRHNEQQAAIGPGSPQYALHSMSQTHSATEETR